MSSLPVHRPGDLGSLCFSGPLGLVLCLLLNFLPYIHTKKVRTYSYIYIYIYIYMKVNMDKIQQYEASRKNIIQIGEYIMM